MAARKFTGKVIKTAEGYVGALVDVELEYDAGADPLTASMTFSSHWMSEPVTWIFDRDLLVQAAGTHEIVGEGDILFRLDRMLGVLHVGLRNPFAHADFTLPACEVHAFLADTDADAARPSIALSAAVDDLLTEILG